MKREHQDKLEELIQSYAAHLRIECQSLYHSGLIDVDSFSTDEYALVKILLTAGIGRTSNLYRPLNGKYREDVNNLRYA